MARRRRFQHGSLFKRGKKNKVWVARFYDHGVESNGEPERIRRSEVVGSVAELPTRRDAERVFSERLRRINTTEYQPRSCCVLRDFALEWESQVLPAVKYATRKHYQYVVHKHLLPAFGEVQLRLISREAVLNFLTAKLRQGLAWRTVRHFRTVFGTILGAAECWGYTEGNPVRKTRLPRHGPRPERAVLAPDELRKLLETLPEPSVSLVWLLVLTGLRIGELLALRWQDVDLRTGVLRVRQTVYDGHFDEPKTRHGNRTIPLGSKGVAILSGRKTASARSDDLVFGTQRGTPLCRRNLMNRQLAPACKALGLEGISWHTLRHSNATLLDAVGTPLGTVQALLGHSSWEITREVYLHSLPAGAREAVEKLEALLNGPKRTQIEEIQNLGTALIQ